MLNESKNTKKMETKKNFVIEKTESIIRLANLIRTEEIIKTKDKQTQKDFMNKLIKQVENLAYYINI